jgi:hypothetical protein
MKVKRKVKAGGTPLNHDEAQARGAGKSGDLKIETGVKAGGITINHNEAQARDAGKPKGLTVRTGVKAGHMRWAKHPPVVLSCRRSAPRSARQMACAETRRVSSE